jgi:hypothetical protein
MTEILTAPLADDTAPAANQRKAWTAPLVIVASGSCGAAKSGVSAPEHHIVTSSSYSS